MDIWIPLNRENAEKVILALREFGFASPELNADLFLKVKSIVRMGVPPLRLEVSNYIDGVEFETSFAEKEKPLIDDLEINLISLNQLKLKKKASGRLKDLNDLEHLP